MSYLAKIKQNASHAALPTLALVAGKANFADAAEEERYWAMRNAILDIARIYDPTEHEKLDPSRREQLASLPLETLADIAKWKAGWIRLIKEHRLKQTR